MSVVGFRSLREATRADWEALAAVGEPSPARKLLGQLGYQRELDACGLPVNVYTHALQTATRALRAGRADDYVVMALFHDIADHLPGDHGLVAAEFLRPWLSDSLLWVLAHHGTFQAANFNEHPQQDTTSYLQFAGHPAFAIAEEFCRVYDAPSFDPDYDTLPLAAFEPYVARVITG